MPRKEQYIEDIMSREFYEFYKKTRRKPSKVIDEYNYFVKAIGGMIRELRLMTTETEYGIHLKDLGVLFKQPFGEYMQKLSLFTHRKAYRKKLDFYLEDDYLRAQFFTAHIMRTQTPTDKKVEDKATAILLHRNLKLKK